jgi:hypothetical protein
MLKDAVDYHDHHGTAKQRKAEKETRRLASAASKTNALQAGEQIRSRPDSNECRAVPACLRICSKRRPSYPRLTIEILQATS